MPPPCGPAGLDRPRRDPAPMDEPRLHEAIRSLVALMGDDPSRPELASTPHRVVAALREIAQGYHVDPHGLLEGAVFEGGYEDMVVVRDIEYYSLCEHDLLPFFGRAHVGYVAAGRVVGLSRVPRVVEAFARRLQLQERLTRQIADFLMEALRPAGVGVVLEGVHLCLMMRGVKRERARVVTSAMLGSFREDPRTRAEFLRIIGWEDRGD